MAISVVIGILAALVIASFYFQELRHAQLKVEQAQESAKVAAKAQEDVAQEKSRLEREYAAKLQQAVQDIQAQRVQLDEIRREISRTVESVERTPPTDHQQVRKDLNELAKSTATITSDATSQRAVVDSGAATSATLQTNTGFMWVGSTGRSNLNNLAGTPALPNMIKVGEEYLCAIDIFLRQGPPGADYVQQPILGIMPEGTRVRVTDSLQSFTRTTGEQYWAKVQVVKLALSSVNLQFAGGSRDQAQLVSKALQEIGYKIPGEERATAAAGKREVRYFYNGQRAVADKLVIDTNQVLKRLGYPLLSSSPVFVGTNPKNNPDGKLELWLDMSSK